MLRTLTSVHFAEFSDAPSHNHAMRLAYEREKGAEDVRRSHMFHGRYENIYIDRARLPELEPIADFAHEMAKRVLGKERLRYGFWFNEMQPGHRTTLHSHEEIDELLSAVYYIESPPESGRLILHDDEAQIDVTPRPGLLVLFPPDLPHEVETNQSQATRLSLAFNFGPPTPET